MTLEMFVPPSGMDPSHDGPRAGAPTLLVLVESFVEVPCAETTTALHVLRALSDDDDVRAVASRELATRRQPMPLSLAHLDEARPVTDVVRITEEMGDRTSWIVGVSLVGGEELALMARRDGNLLGEILDAFTMDRPVRQSMSLVVDTLQPGMDVAVVDGAEARAALERGFEMSDDVTLNDVTPDEPDAPWPHTRPLARWAVSLLPDGGTLPSYADWDIEARNAYLVDLLDSPELASLLADDGEDTVRNASLALDFSLDRVDDDPDPWSPRKLALLLLDFVPQKVIAPADELLGLVDVMRAWTQRSVRLRGLSAEGARNLRDALDALEPEFRLALDDAAAHPNLTMQALLDAAGLDSVEQLAALDPGELMGLLPGGILSDGPGLGGSTGYGMADSRRPLAVRSRSAGSRRFPCPTSPSTRPASTTTSCHASRRGCPSRRTSSHDSSPARSSCAPRCGGRPR